MDEIRWNKTLIKNGCWLFMLQVFNTVVPLVTLPYITRVLGATNYGIYSISLNWVLYFQVIVEYGFGFTGARKVSIQSETDCQTLYNRIITARIVLLFISYILMNLIGFVQKISIERYVCMNILFLVIVGVAFQLTWLYQGKQEMKYITIVNAFSRVLSVAAVFLVVKERSNLNLYCLCYSSTFIISAVIGICIAYKKYGLVPKLCSFKEAFDEIKDGWYLFVSQAMSKIIGAVGTTVLGIVTIESDIGIYSAIYKLPQVMILFFNPISQALYPHVSMCFSESFDKGKNTVIRSMKYVLPFFVIGAFVICKFRSQIIELSFGAEFVGHDLIVFPLMGWMLFSVVNNFLGVQFLVASGKQKIYSYAITIGASVTIALNLLLGWRYKVYGVSLAALFGELSLTLIMIIFILKSRRIENRAV